MSGAVLNHRFYGGENHPPLVILHGLLGSSRNWNHAGKALTESFSVYALDLRNHGSSFHTETHTYADMAGDLTKWIDRMGFSSVSLMGHSMGGKVGMRFACHFPDRVEQLYIADISPRDYDPHYDVYLKAMDAISLEALSSRKDADQMLQPSVTSEGMRQFLLTNLVRDEEEGGYRWQVNIPVLLQAMPGLAANPLHPDDAFEGPTLFLRGGKSVFITEDDRGLIRCHFPSSHLVTLKEAGHNIHVDDRETFVEAVLRAKQYFDQGR
jgi:pimeloyl-ACP methyl ester carboxylesterase